MMVLFNLHDDTDGDGDESLLCARCGGDVVKAQCMARQAKHVYRRAFSEVNLLEILDYDLADGTSYHCISGGDIDSLSFLKHILRQQSLEYLLFSTWCMAYDDVLQFREWIDRRKILRLDAYCGEIFPGSYRKQYDGLRQVVSLCGGRVAIFRNHSKVYAGIGNKFAFAIESSANINTNPRTENTTIHIDLQLFYFYKSFYDGIKSYTQEDTQWRPWEVE